MQILCIDILERDMGGHIQYIFVDVMHISQYISHEKYGHCDEMKCKMCNLQT